VASSGITTLVYAAELAATERIEQARSVIERSKEKLETRPRRLDRHIMLEVKVQEQLTEISILIVRVPSMTGSHN
jgi:hypothetical protein